MAEGTAAEAVVRLPVLVRNARVIALVPVRIVDRVMAVSVRWKVRLKKNLLARFAILSNEKRWPPVATTFFGA